MKKLEPWAMPLKGTAEEAYSTDATVNDPYRYLIGFDNRFNSEALKGVLPSAQNTPQHVKYDLYSEQLNGSAVVSSRKDIRHVWMYRIRPSVAHGGFRASPNVNKHVGYFYTCDDTYANSILMLILRCIICRLNPASSLQTQMSNRLLRSRHGIRFLYSML